MDRKACNVKKCNDGFLGNVMEYNRRRLYYQFIGFVVGFFIVLEVIGLFTGALHPVAFFIILPVTIVAYFVLLGLYRRREKE